MVRVHCCVKSLCDWGCSVWEHANKVLIKVIGKFVKLPQLFHFFVVNDLH